MEDSTKKQLIEWSPMILRVYGAMREIETNPKPTTYEDTFFTRFCMTVFLLVFIGACVLFGFAAQYIISDGGYWGVYAFGIFLAFISISGIITFAVTIWNLWFD